MLSLVLFKWRDFTGTRSQTPEECFKGLYDGYYDFVFKPKRTGYRHGQIIRSSAPSEAVQLR